MKTVKDFLKEAKKVDRKAEKILDDVMNSEYGNKLAAAMNDGDESKIEKILTQYGVKGKMLNSILSIMFGDM